MALVPGNLVHETSVTTGTGNQTLVAVDGKRTFNTEHGTGGTDLFDYFISNPDASEWERGTGHMSTSTVLVRDTVIQSSNGDAAVSFTAGTKNVTNDLPSSEQAGVWDLIETVIADADTTVDIINLSSTYFVYKFAWSDMQPGTTSTTLMMRTDANNGASFDAGTSDYAYANHRLAMDPTSPAHAVRGEDSFTSMEIQINLETGSNAHSSFELLLFNPSDTEYTKAVWAGTIRATIGSFWIHNTGAGIRLSAALVDAVRFFFSSSATVLVGTLKVYGMKP